MSHTEGVQEGRPPSAEDLFYLEWAQESLRNNLKIANGVLKQMVTLSSGLLAATFAFEEDWSLALAVAALLSCGSSFISALLGLLPHERFIEMNNPNAIKEHKAAALRSKLRYLWFSAFALVAHLVVMFTKVLSELE